MAIDDIELEHDPDARPENVELARLFLGMMPRDPGRAIQARALANYKGDFLKEATENGTFPEIYLIGPCGYADLKDLVERKYDKWISLPGSAFRRRRADGSLVF